MQLTAGVHRQQLSRPRLLETQPQPSQDRRDAQRRPRQIGELSDPRVLLKAEPQRENDFRAYSHVHRLSLAARYATSRVLSSLRGLARTSRECKGSDGRVESFYNARAPCPHTFIECSHGCRVCGSSPACRGGCSGCNTRCGPHPLPGDTCTPNSEGGTASACKTSSKQGVQQQHRPRISLRTTKLVVTSRHAEKLERLRFWRRLALQGSCAWSAHAIRCAPRRLHPYSNAAATACS